MRQIFIILLVATLGLSTASARTFSEESKMNILVAFFSRADENYAVGKVTKGNTQIVAELIHAEVGGDMFHIETVKPYPANYDECIEVAQREKRANARPEIKGDSEVEGYDVVFVGMPNWWGDMPMAVYTFIERHNWQGKTIIPFATHEGSGMGGMDLRLQKACKGATVLNGYSVYGHEAQNNRDKVKTQVKAWLDRCKF